MQKGNFTQLLNQFTTDYRTQIYVLKYTYSNIRTQIYVLKYTYTNIRNHVLTAGALESYYSDHKPIFVCLV